MSTSRSRRSTVTPPPSQVWHGCSTIAPRPRAVRARVRAHELAEDAARHLLQPAGAAAARAVDGLRARLDAVAAAGRARDGHVERHLHLRAGRRLAELDLDRRADVGAAPAAPAAAAAEDVVAEEGREDVARGRPCRSSSAGSRRSAGRRARSGRRARASRSSTAPRTPRSPRGIAARSSGSVETSGCSCAGELAERLLDRRVVGVARRRRAARSSRGRSSPCQSSP